MERPQMMWRKETCGSGVRGIGSVEGGTCQPEGPCMQSPCSDWDICLKHTPRGSGTAGVSLVSERTANRRQGGDVGAADGSGPSGPWQRLVRVILNEVGDSGHLLKTNAPPHGKPGRVGCCFCISGLWCWNMRKMPLAFWQLSNSPMTGRSLSL